MTMPAGAVLLGTVALEPNRWGTVDPSGAPSLRLAGWLPEITAAGFDGIELWERHVLAEPDGGAAVLAGPPPITVLNSYASFDDADPAARVAAAEWAARTRCAGVKFNVGHDRSAQGTYAERIAAWLDDLPPGVVALCECHEGISIAEDPAVAAAIFAAAGPVDRVQAIVHTHEGADHLRARFAAYGDRITHVHVNYLAGRPPQAPRLADVRDDLVAKAALLTSLGFRGSWTIEFVHGLLTDRDRPADTLAQAGADLAVLRDVLGEVGP